MKALYRFITEAINKSSKKLEAAYALSKNPDRARCPKNLRASKHGHEYIRGYFGDDEDTAIESVKQMLKGIGVNLDIINFEYGMFRDASGQYNAVKITSSEKIDIKDYSFCLDRNNYLYVINTSVGNSKIRRKVLTPDNLGLTKNSYNNKEDLIKDVEKGLINSKLEDYAQAILSLCNCINSNENSHDLNDILDNKITYTASIDELGDLTKNDLNNIANDFGEILGPLMLMDKLQGEVVLSYPTDSNAKLYDYVINEDIWVSAKAGKGAVPSAVDTMKLVMSKIQDLTERNLFDIAKASKEEKEFLEIIVPIIADDEKKNSGSAIRRQTWNLAIELGKLDCDKINNALNLFEKYGLTITENGISEDEINALYKEDKLKDLLNTLYNTIDYNPSNKYSISEIISNFESLDKKTKEGMILYPIKTIITEFINNKYGYLSDHDYISEYANKVMSGYQMYLNKKITDNSITITFEPKAMEKNKFKLKAQGSVGDPLLKSMGIEMIK